MKQHIQLVSLCALLAALAAGARADVIVVDAAGGAGADALEIAAAVALAADGDTILVRAGSYAPFTVDGKALTIAEDTGAEALVDGPITVRNLAPAQAVLLRGLGTGVSSGPGLVAEDNAGPLRLEGCALLGKDGTFSGFQHGREGVLAQDCASLTLVRCTIRGGDGYSSSQFGFGGFGGSGVVALATTVSAYGSTIAGGDGAFGDDIGGQGADGLYVSGGFAFAGGCDISGGHGGAADDDYDFFCDCIVCGAPGGGGSGLALVGADGAVLGSTLAGGAGGGSSETCSDGPAGAPTSVGGGTLTEFAGVARSLRIPGPVREGEDATLVLDGEVGELALVMFSPLTGHLYLPQFRGTLLVPVTSPILAIAAIPPRGLLVLSVPVPELPAGFESAVVHVQSIFQTAGGVVLGSPATLIVVDDSF